MRKLATIRKINDLQPIEGADKIELATVDGWKVVVTKGLNIGDKIVYCEIDSFLPIKPEFEFLRKSSYKKLIDGTEGFRLKTIKLRGQISQGLCIPLNELPQLANNQIGDDVSEILGIIKYDPPIPASLSGLAKGNFPSFLRKTDEERVQNLAKEYQEYLKSGKKFYATEKLDGSSATFYLRDGVFGVCSRNLELKEEVYVPEYILCEDGVIRTKKQNSFWKVARELDIENKLKQLPFNACLQGELIGEGIQGNPYNIKGHSVRFFNLFNIDTYEYKPIYDLDNFCNENDLQTVPIVSIIDFSLPKTIDDLLILAEGKSNLFDCEREGLVIRDIGNTISFKVISNKFLINNNN
jgi:RNA ligase (TIGR02306 family)